MSNRNTDETGPPTPDKPPVRRAVPLRTARDARKLLGRLVNEVRRDEFDSQKASRIGYLVSVFLRSVETDEIAQRVDAIEKRMEGQK